MAFDNLGNLIPDQPGGTVSISVGAAGDSATIGDDYESASELSVTVGEIFNITAKDDHFADNNESFTLTLNDDWSNPEDFDVVSYGNTSVTTTIRDETDNDPATPGDNDNAFTLKLFLSDADGNILSGPSEIHEDAGNGDTTAFYVVKAVDAEGNPLTNQPTGTVNVSFTDGSATTGIDYTFGNTTVSVGSAFSATSIDDTLADNSENFVVSLDQGSFSDAGRYEAVEYAPDTVTTTILDETDNDPGTPGDNDSAFTLKLFPADENGNVINDPSTIYEDAGNGSTTAYYVVKAVDGNGIPLADQPTGTVNVSFTDGSATTGADYNFGGTTVNVGTAFSATSVDDYWADNNENFTVSLEAGSFSDASTYETVEYAPDTVTTTILDETANDPAVPGDNDSPFILKLFPSDANGNIVSDPSEIYEDAGNGSTTAYYVVKAVDESGTPLAEQPTGTVSVSFNDGSATTGADYTFGATTVNLGSAFSAVAVDDVLADNAESFTVSLDVGSYSNAAPYETIKYAPDTVTTTILDETSNDPATPGDNDSAFTFKLFSSDASGNIVTDPSVIHEDSDNGSTTAYYVVKAIDANGTPLANQPAGTVGVSFAGGSATAGVDYTFGGTTVGVGSAFSAVSIDDALADNAENFIVSLDAGSYSNAATYETVTYAPDTVTTTILDETANDPGVPADNDTAFSLKLFASDEHGNVISDPSVIHEDASNGDNTAYYVVKAVDANGTLLSNQPAGSVNVSFTDGTATTGDDYTFGNTTVNVGSAFSAVSVDDVLADNAENFVVSLDSGSFSNAATYEKVEYAPDTVTTTILDETSNDPATPGDNDNAFTLKLFAADANGNIVTNPSEIHEDANNGDTTAYYVVKAVDANGDPLATQPAGTVNVSFIDGTATTGTDYTFGNTTVSVDSAFSAVSVDDVLADNAENFTVSLDSDSYSNAATYETVTYAPDTVVTTILDETANDPATPGDNDNAFTLKLFAADANGNIVTDPSEIHEDANNGDTTAYYVVKAVDANGDPLVTQPTGTVNVSFTDGTATTGADYTFGNTTVSVDSAFSAVSVDDVLADNDENFTVSLDSGSYSNAATYETVTYAPDTVVTTILDETANDPATPGDNDSAFTLKLFAADANGNIITDPSEIHEDASNGDTTAYYVVKAVDANGDPLTNQPVGTVNVSFTDGTATTGDDYTFGNTTVSVDNAFSAVSVDDVLADNAENFTVSLDSGSYSNAATYETVTYAPGTVVTTILDETANDPAIPGDNDSAFTLKLFAADANGNIITDPSEIHEDASNGDTTAYYVVKAVDENGDPLATQPTGTVNVSFTDGTATTGDDYTFGNTTVSVDSAFSAVSVDDVLADNAENFTVSLDAGSFSNAATYETVEYAPDTVVTTILDETDNDPATPGDNDSAFTLKLFAADANGNIITDPSEIHEDASNGDTTAYYVVKAVDGNGDLLADQPTGTVNVSFTDDTATTGDDYTFGNTTVSVGSAFSAVSVDDFLSDNGEKFTVSLDSGSYSNAATYETVTYAPDTVLTTILDETENDPATPGDNDSPFTLKLFAADANGNIVTDPSEIHEDAGNGDTTAYYVVKAVDENGDPLADQPTGTVSVSFTDDTATTGDDYTFGNTTVSIDSAFSAVSVDDVLADNGEKFTVSLDSGSYSEDAGNTADGSGRYETVEYAPDTVITTILDETDNDPATPGDNDSAFTLKLFAADANGNIITDPSEIHEDASNGDTTAYYVVKAVDENGDPLTNQPAGTVNVSFTDGTATTGDDYTFGNTTVSVDSAFSAVSVDDVLADNAENFTVSLDTGSFSNAATYETVEYASDTVVTTILDETDNDPGTPGDNDSAFTLKLFAADANGNIVTDPSEIHEDASNGDTTAYYVVKAVDENGDPLTNQPTGTVDITFTDGTATTGDDYTFGNTTVSVDSAFSAVSVDDALADNAENFTVSLDTGSFSNAATYETVEYAPDTVITTIFDETANDPAVPGDNDSAFTLKLFAADENGDILRDGNGNPIDATEISEPGTQGGESTAYYVVKAVDAAGDLLANQPQGTVDVTFANGTGISNDDYSGPGTQTVTVGEKFTATAQDDDVSDSGENFVVSLNDGSFSNAGLYETVDYAPDTVTTTILDETTTNTPNDNDSAYTLKLFAADNQGTILRDGNGDPVDATQIHEDGGTSAYYVVKALDENGDFVDLSGHVDVRFNNNSAESNDYSISGTQVELDEVFHATAINDSWTDNGETFTVELVENSYSEDAAYTPGGEYETVDYDDATVTTTIRDLDIAGVEDNANTQEGAGAGGDWDISILENLDAIHNQADFTSITISDIPTDAVLKDGDGNTLTVNGGEYTATSWQDALELTLTPAVDSSKDIELDYQLELQDGSFATFTQSIVITPEADQPWTLDELTSESVTYQEKLLEDDGWQSLDAGWSDGVNVFDELTASTGDADGSESNTYVRFYSDGDTNLPANTQIRYEDSAGNTQTYTFQNSNSYVDIPASNLDTLEIKTPTHFNGELSLKIKTGVIDWDEDNASSYDNRWSENGESNQVWGEPDTLIINVTGSADLDDNLISVTSVRDDEDSGRDQNTGNLTQNADGTYDISDAIDLEINFRTDKYTNTEVIELKVEDIPADTFIFDTDGNMLNGDGSGGSLDSIKIVLDPSNGQHYTPQPGEVVLTTKEAFNSFVENLSLIPAHDSNEDFTLTLNQKSTEPNWDGTVGGQQTKEVTDTFEVQLNSVADNPTVSGTDAPIELTESGEWQNLSGFQISSGEEQHFSEEVYALIRNVPTDVGLRVVDSNGNELFDKLVLADTDGSTTEWRIDNDTLQKIDSGDYHIQLKTPDVDMSGSIEFGIRVTVLDLDPDSGQQTDTLVSDHTMTIVVEPEVESYGDSQSSGNEDEWIDLNLNVGSSDGDTLIEGQYDYNGTAYDMKIEIPGLGQTSEDIQVQGDNLVIDYANNLIYLNQDDLASVEVMAPQHSNEDLSGIQFYRYLKDDMDDGSTSHEDIQEVVTGHSVNVTGVADGWEDTDNPDNDTTDDTDGSDDDGFVTDDVEADASGNINTALSDIVTNNSNVEDSYHDTVPGIDASESEYYVIRDQSGLDAPNTTWMVENGINAGNGVWVVPADAFDSANIKILQANAGDGSLDLEILPVSKENDGDILFDQPHTFTIEYAGGNDTIATVNGGSLVISGSAPNITVSEKDTGQEDTQVNDVFDGTTASGGAELSYVVPADANNGSVDTSDMYQLPDGSFVGTGEIDFNPDANFNGDAGFDVEIIATDSSGNQSIVSETVVLDIDPVLDDAQASAQGGTEIDDSSSESIDLNIQITSADTDGSETLQGDITLTPQSGGQLTGTGITDNGDGSYTIAPENLGSVAFVPDAYSHGTYSFEISYTRIDTDANGVDHAAETVTETFSINLASEVDQIEVNLNPSADSIDEAEDYPLDLSVLQHDSDGSEVSSVKISGVPDALVIQDANGNQIGNYSDNGDGTIDIVLKGDEVPSGGGLKLHDTTETYGGTFTLEVTAFSMDKVTKEIEEGTDNVTLTINPVASDIEEVDAGSAQTNRIEGVEDNTGMPLDLDVIMTDLDGSEKLKITFSDEFNDNGFSAKYTDSNGVTQTLTDNSLLAPDEAQSIQLVPGANYSGDFNLTVNVQSVEVDANGNVLDTLATPVSKTVEITIDPEADSVTIDSINDQTVVEDSSAVDLGLALTLEDANEALNLSLSGLEPGSKVSVSGKSVNVGGNGKANLNNLTEAEAETLSIKPPADYSGTMNINLKVKTVDGTDVLDTAVKQSFNFTVTAEADQPNLDDPRLSNEVDNGDGTFSYDLDLSASLTDNSEELSLRVDGLPAGSSLTNGSGDNLVISNGSVTLTPDQLNGLTLTSPVQLVSDGAGGLNIEVTAISTEDMDTADASDDDSAIQTKTIIDGVIEGLAYETSSGLSGVTDQQGSFQYREGDSVTFKVGDVVIGTATPEDMEQSNIFLQDLANVDRSDLNDEYVENMGVFLQSLDADGNPDNGITIGSDAHILFDGVSLNLKTATESEVKSVLEQAGKTAVSEEAAMAHVKSMLEQHSDQTDFEQHIDDSVVTANLANSAIDGLSYQTSSGLNGELSGGSFQFDEGDTVELYLGDQLVASFDASDVGSDSVITFEEAGFTMSLEELQALQNPETAEEGAEESEETAVESEVDEKAVSDDGSEGESNESAGETDKEEPVADDTSAVVDDSVDGEEPVADDISAEADDSTDEEEPVADDTSAVADDSADEEEPVTDDASADDASAIADGSTDEEEPVSDDASAEADDSADEEEPVTDDTSAVADGSTDEEESVTDEASEVADDSADEDEPVSDDSSEVVDDSADEEEPVTDDTSAVANDSADEGEPVSDDSSEAADDSADEEDLVTDDTSAVADDSADEEESVTDDTSAVADDSADEDEPVTDDASEVAENSADVEEAVQEDASASDDDSTDEEEPVTDDTSEVAESSANGEESVQEDVSASDDEFVVDESDDQGFTNDLSESQGAGGDAVDDLFTYSENTPSNDWTNEIEGEVETSSGDVNWVEELDAAESSSVEDTGFDADFSDSDGGSEAFEDLLDAPPVEW